MELCLLFDQKGILVQAAQRIAELLEAEMAVVYFLDRGSGDLVGYTNEKKTQVSPCVVRGSGRATFPGHLRCTLDSADFDDVSCASCALQCTARKPLCMLRGAAALHKQQKH